MWQVGEYRENKMYVEYSHIHISVHYKSMVRVGKTKTFTLTVVCCQLLRGATSQRVCQVTTWPDHQRPRWCHHHNWRFSWLLLKRIVPCNDAFLKQVKQLPYWDRTPGSLQWECPHSGFSPAAPTVYLLVVPRIEPKPVWHHRSKTPVWPEGRIGWTWGQTRAQLKISLQLRCFWMVANPFFNLQPHLDFEIKVSRFLFSKTNLLFIVSRSAWSSMKCWDSEKIVGTERSSQAWRTFLALQQRIFNQGFMWYSVLLLNQWYSVQPLQYISHFNFKSTFSLGQVSKSCHRNSQNLLPSRLYLHRSNAASHSPPHSFGADQIGEIQRHLRPSSCSTRLLGHPTLCVPKSPARYHSSQRLPGESVYSLVGAVCSPTVEV